MNLISLISLVSRTRFIFLFCSALLLLGCVTNTENSNNKSIRTPDNFGLMLMAHGGGLDWNKGVETAVKPLREDMAVEIVYGMADAKSMQETVDKLEASGVTNIGVIRLFISGESFFERTEKILGIRKGAPDRYSKNKDGTPLKISMMGGKRTEFWQLETDASFALSKQGLSEAHRMNAILADRALAMSNNPLKEDVLILAHGPGDDGENQRWIDNITARSSSIKLAAPFRRVQVMTLREDWPGRRIDAEKQIRDFVQRAENEDGTTIVIPFRTHGFGPYHKVLEGLDYRSNGKGLLPHKNVSLWIEEQVVLLKSEQFQKPK